MFVNLIRPKNFIKTITMKKFLFLFFVVISTAASSQNTNNDTLDEIINRVADTVTGQKGAWKFKVKERLLICITDENNNRMRIISPITEVSNLTEEDLLKSLLANFHTALDVKYAISEDVLWSVFIHPLAELSEAQMEDAIIQVYNAAETYGTIYSSTNLSFPGAFDQKEPTEIKEKIELQKG